jgi:hypothetical protein
MAGTISGSASFVGGLTGSWSFQYTSDMPGVTLQSIVLDLSPTDLRFDTASGGFGSLSYLDVGGFDGTDVTTGLTGISATGAALDGGTLLTFTFNNFLSGSTFQFSADVDHPDPTLVGLLSCAGKTGVALIVCNATNLGRTATNDARLLAAETVGPNPMAGALVTYNFTGGGVENEVVTGTLQPFTLGNGFASTADVSTPEPASMATFGPGLSLLIALVARCRRTSAAHQSPQPVQRSAKMNSIGCCGIS